MQDGSNTKAGSQATSWPGLFPMDAMAGFNLKAMTATLAFNGNVVSYIMTINSGRAAFLRMRLNEDIEFWQELASSRNPDQIFAAYSAFLQNAVEQYQAEFTRVLTLGQAFASQSMDRLEPSAETPSDEGARRNALPTTRHERARAVDGRQLDSAA